MTIVNDLSCSLSLALSQAAPSLETEPVFALRDAAQISPNGQARSGATLCALRAHSPDHTA